MTELSLTIELSDDELATLRFAASEAQESVEMFMLQCALNHAEAKVKHASKRVANLTQPVPDHYIPEHPNSPWIQMLGTARGLYASPEQALSSLKGSRK